MKHCNHPWSGLEIGTDGSLTPCCKFRTELFPGWPGFNIRNGIESYSNSDQLRSLRDDFLRGVETPACVRCWKDEAAGLKSKRQLDLERFGQTDDKIRFLTLPLGNHCNLKCRICGPANSTAWIKEWSELTGTKMPVQDWHRDKDVWDRLIGIAQGCLEIHLHGGEPFLLDNREHLQMMTSLVESGNAKNIRLHYSTNGTIMPTDELWDHWQSFNSVDVQVSIDDYGARFEYNRYPAKWESVRDNLLSYRQRRDSMANMQFSISTTVSAFTIFYLEEFMIEMARLRLPKPWLGRLHDPAYYRPDIFPAAAKDAIYQRLRLSRIKDVASAAEWLADDGSANWSRFLEMVQWQDRYRSEKFVDVFPELAKLLDM